MRAVIACTAIVFTGSGCTGHATGDACPARARERSCTVVGHTQPHGRPAPGAADETDSGASEDDAGPTDGTATRRADSGVGAGEEQAGAEQALMTHPILVDELVNARDLGGVPVTVDSRVAYGALFRGPPLLLSAAGCDEFEALGVRTVIDLRVAGEREIKPDAACAAKTSRLVAAPLPVPYNVSPEDYLTDLDTAESIVDVFAVLADDDAYPVYFHCTWGRDRTGIVAAVILLALGVARDDVMREYLLSLDSVGAYPASLNAVLDEIERRGGVSKYLAAFGIGARALATLRAHALPGR